MSGLGGPYGFDKDAVPVRPVQRARLAVPMRSAATPGSSSLESAVSWSPDGELIAVTHLALVRGRGFCWATIVVDLAGTVVWQCLGGAIPPASNAAWVGPRELMVGIEAGNCPLVIVDVRDGSQREVGEALPIPRAVVGDRIVRNARPDLGMPREWELITTNFDRSDPQPLLTATPGPVGIDGCDIARFALPL